MRSILSRLKRSLTGAGDKEKFLRKLGRQHPANRYSAYRDLPATAPSASKVLDDLRESKEAINIHGQKVSTPNFVSSGEGQILYSLARELKPTLALEIGLMHGYSTLHLLQALEDNGGAGRLLSMDPFQLSDAAGIGLMNIRRAGLAHRSIYWEEYSQYGLPDLCRVPCPVQMAFVDGSHFFDFTMLEFFYIDKILEKDGVLVFHDYKYPSVFSAVDFVINNFHYEQQSCTENNLAVLRKKADDDRPWWTFRPFEVPQISWDKIEDRQFVDTSARNGNRTAQD